MLKAAEVIARVPRSQLRTAELRPGYAVIAVGLGAGGLAELTIDNIAGAVVRLAIAIPAGWYD
jgi:hypothetical protein